MYESEVNNIIAKGEEIPEIIMDKFRNFRGQIDKKSLLPWTEHCIECVWPTCYTSCSLYDPRKDGKCRRFKNGMIRIPLGENKADYLLKVIFKKWGKLYAQGTTQLFSMREARKREWSDILMGQLIQHTPGPSALKKRLYQKRYGIKNRRAKKEIYGQIPELFVVEIFNPQDRLISATLTFRPDGQKSSLPFQQLLKISPGYNQLFLNTDEIHIDFSASFKVEITPNDIIEGETLYFGVLDFIESKIQSGNRNVKCVIWDLDNTLWEGTLIEDGHKNLKIKGEVLETIRALDKAGILQSISSKNNHEEALPVLKDYNIEDYFLLPQMNWGPKSTSIGHIVKALNIGMDTVVFIDDQPFEREEAHSVFKNLRVLDPEKLNLPEDLLNMIEIKNTAESSNRRKLYQQELNRKKIEETFEGSYLSFLKECNLKISIEGLNSRNFERVHELVQRTNQMNFSGNRYTKEELLIIQHDETKQTFVLHVKDKFGDYGIVGFGIFDVKRNYLADLTFSCRVQSKRVEHAFLSWFMKEIKNNYGKYPEVIFNKTTRNAPSGKVFDDFGFKKNEDNTQNNVLYLPVNADLPNDNIIEISVE